MTKLLARARGAAISRHLIIRELLLGIGRP